jgi:hypothetical protein
MFTKRNEADLDGNPGLQDRTREALRERGGQLIMFGDAGVGKTTLLKYAAEDEGMNILSIKARSKSFDEPIGMAIREVTAEREVDIVRTSGAEWAARPVSDRSHDQGPPKRRAGTARIDAAVHVGSRTASVTVTA